MHQLSITFNNSYRKYDGIFAPNDRVVVQLKRFKWLQVFAGYLDTVPYFSTFPRAVTLRASCPIKALQNFPWDAGTMKAYSLLHGPRDKQAQDGGLSTIITKLLTDVVQWSPDRIHIGRVPVEWHDKFKEVYAQVSGDVDKAISVIGINPIMNGSSQIGTQNTDLNPQAQNSQSIVTSEDDYVWAPADMDVALATIRQMESRDNYKSVNKGDGSGQIASGAYQFITNTWHGYGGYTDAYEAPNQVQDQKAVESINGIINAHGAMVINIPYGWFLPAVFQDPSKLDADTSIYDKTNKGTVRDYGKKWLGVYLGKYAALHGGSLPPRKGQTAASLGAIFSTTASQTPSNIPTQIPNVGSGTNSSSSTSVFYPIPVSGNGANGLDVAKSAWGGYQNGRVPSSALAHGSGHIFGHPAAAASFSMMMAAANKDGINIDGGMYRSIDAQAAGSSQSKSFAPAGQSNHGWGLACDIFVLSSGGSPYASPTYLWLKTNAYKYGWGHPTWAQQGGQKPEPWHWEFEAFENFRHQTDATGGTGINPFSNAPSTPGGIGGVSGQPGGFGAMPQPTSDQLFAGIAFWNGAINSEIEIESLVLTGYKAPMNDIPILETLKPLISAAARRFCSAPNGDFMAWFPDYWGEYGIAGKLNVETIELKDFSVSWSDQNLITHQYVEGGLAQAQFGPIPTGSRSAISGYTTKGVATVDLPRFLESVVNVAHDEYPWMKNPAELLKRFGARINRASVPVIVGAEQEFWFAVQKFMLSWAAQFNAYAPMTFMPELWPGMLLALPDYGVQFYVATVTHSFNFANGAGFTTDAQVMAPSAIDGTGFFLFPKGGKGPTRQQPGGSSAPNRM